MGFKLFTHQEVAYSHLVFNDYFALFMEQGTGKTLPVLVHINELLKTGQIENALVVVTKAGIGAWYRDMEMFDIESQTRMAKAVTVINYDMVWRTKKGVQPYRKKWDFIVLDESQSIKNRTSKRASFLLELALDAKYRYILTGTPISNSKIEQLWSQYAFLKPVKIKRSIGSELFGGTYYDFLDEYAILNKYYTPYKYKNVSQFQEIMSANSYRVEKKDCLDLPEKLPDEIIKVEMSGQLKKDYNEMMKHSTLMEHELLAENAASRMIRERQMASGFINNNGEIIEYKHDKLNVLNDLLDATDKKVVIFCHFTKSIDDVVSLLNKKKIKHEVLDGRQKDKLIWRKFQEDDSMRVFVVQYRSGNAGIDLFSSDTIIYYEPTDSSEFLEQSRDRIHRTGQKEKCSYYHLITTGTVEVSMYRALANYQDFNEKLYNGHIDSYRKGAKVK